MGNVLSQRKWKFVASAEVCGSWFAHLNLKNYQRGFVKNFRDFFHYSKNFLVNWSNFYWNLMLVNTFGSKNHLQRKFELIISIFHFFRHENSIKYFQSKSGFPPKIPNHSPFNIQPSSTLISLDTRMERQKLFLFFAFSGIIEESRKKCILEFQ